LAVVQSLATAAPRHPCAPCDCSVSRLCRLDRPCECRPARSGPYRAVAVGTGWPTKWQP